MFKINNKKEFLLVIIFICTYLLVNIETRQKKQKPKPPKKIYDPRNKRPSRITPELYCDICKSIVKESAAALFNKKKAYEVIDVIEKICESENLYPIQSEYVNRKDACDVFVASWNEHLEKILVKRIDDISPINELCINITKSCDIENEVNKVDGDKENFQDEEKTKKEDI